MIPPNINFDNPNPKSKLRNSNSIAKLLIFTLVPFETGNLHVPVEAMPWPKDRPLRAGVSSFGLGGANAHVSPWKHIQNMNESITMY